MATHILILTGIWAMLLLGMMLFFIGIARRTEGRLREFSIFLATAFGVWIVWLFFQGMEIITHNILIGEQAFFLHVLGTLIAFLGVWRLYVDVRITCKK